MSEHGHHRYEELLPPYVLGALDEPEHTEFTEHLETCPSCRDDLARWQGDLAAVTEQVASNLPTVTPSAHTRARLLAQTKPPVETTSHAPAPRPLPWATLAASLLAVVLSLAALSGRLFQQPPAQTAGVFDRLRVERLEEELARSSSEVRALREQVERLTLAVRTLSAPAGRSYVLAGLGGAAGAGGATFVDPEMGRATFTAFGLAPAPAGKTYQLWWIADGQPVSAGVFEVDEAGTGGLTVDQVPEQPVDLWAVTVEPAGGVPQPTGEMVLKSRV